jgi:hypothetical protein
MEELLDPKNWSDLIGDSSFWNAAIILLIAIAALLAALYSDQIHEWRVHRQERAKWLFWHR